MNKTLFDADAFSALTDTPTTKIDYLVRAGILEPAVPASRRGVSRKYNIRNLFEAAVAMELINAGVLADDVRAAVAKAKPSPALLVLYRRTGSLDPVMSQLDSPKDVGNTANAGYTIIAAVPVGYIARQIQDRFPGAQLA